LSDVGIDASQFDLIAEAAMRHIFTRANPMPIRSREDLTSILKAAA